jgi:hypothetical protein
MPKRVKKAPARDENESAFALVRQVTKQDKETTVTADELSRVMAMLGRAGGKKGGKQRLVTMTPEQRSSIALKAARARWAKAKKKRSG